MQESLTQESLTQERKDYSSELLIEGRLWQNLDVLS